MFYTKEIIKNISKMKTFLALRVPTVSFIYNRRKTAKKGHTASVELRIAYDRKSKYISTGMQLLPKEWVNGTVTNRPDAQQLNNSLSMLRNNVMTVINESTLKSPLSGFKPDNIRLAHNPSC